MGKNLQRKKQTTLGFWGRIRGLLAYLGAKAALDSIRCTFTTEVYQAFTRRWTAWDDLPKADVIHCPCNRFYATGPIISI